MKFEISFSIFWYGRSLSSPPPHGHYLALAKLCLLDFLFFTKKWGAWFGWSWLPWACCSSLRSLPALPLCPPPKKGIKVCFAIELLWLFRNLWNNESNWRVWEYRRTWLQTLIFEIFGERVQFVGYKSSLRLAVLIQWTISCSCYSPLRQGGFFRYTLQERSFWLPKQTVW